MSRLPIERGMGKKEIMKTVLFTAASMLLLVSVPGRADTESPELVKYRASVDLAVQRALAFMATLQKPDGSFDDRLLMNATVGLPGMAYLSAGHTPGQGPYGKVINRCIDYILATPMGPGIANRPTTGQVEGYLARGNPYGRMYSHAIATLFLCEVSGMVDPERQKKIDALLPKALKLILTAQAVEKEEHLAGGWRYSPHDSSSDLSISGWNLMALRSARLNGAPVPAEAVTKAIEFVERCHNPVTGGFDYQPGSPTAAGPGSPPSPAMSAVGLLCRELCGRHNDEMNRGCGAYLLQLAQGDGFMFKGSPEEMYMSYGRPYTIYYSSQGMFQLGGKYWAEFAPLLYKHLLNTQGSDGGWNQVHYGRAYETAMRVLALTVTYRQLPIYQR